MSNPTTHWVVGIDVAVKSAHKVAIFDRSTGEPVRRTLSIPRTWEGVQKLAEVLGKADRVEVAIEPAGNAWRPLAGALHAFGFTLYLVDPKKSSRLRKALSDHVKSDRIDAEALARLLLMAQDKLDRLELPTPKLARLRDLVRHRDRLAQDISARKTRIQAAVGQIQPTLMEGLGEDKFLNAYRAFLRKYVDPRKILRLGKKRLHGFLDRRHRGSFDPARTEKIFRAARSGAQLLELQQEAGRSSFEPEQIQLEICMELDLLEAEEGQIRELERRIVSLYDELDPAKALHTVPGFGPIISAGVLGETGTIERFPNLGSYRGYVSLIPRFKATGQSHNPRQKLRKAGPRLLKKYFYLAADNARKCDLELAALYTRLRRRGRVHDQAVCAVANKLAGRAYAIMKRMAQGRDARYVYRDLDGRPISKQDARRQVQRLFPGPAAKRQKAASANDPARPKERIQTEARRPQPAFARPPASDASSSNHGTPRHISQILADPGLAQLIGTTKPGVHPNHHDNEAT